MVTAAEQICKEVEAFYKSYAAAFSREDVAAASECFACPCAFITGRGLDQYATERDIQRMLGHYIADLKERGWVRSDMELKTWPMAEDLAMILVDGTRYKVDGSMLEQVRVCYIVRRDANNWKIVTISEIKPPFLGPGDLPR